MSDLLARNTTQANKMTLVTIEKIKDLQPIENADNIVLATVQGWQCVVGKNDFTVGDLCVFIPIDVEVNTNSPLFRFLAPSTKKNKEWCKIATKKLRGIYSQGLALPLVNLRGSLHYDITSLKEGDDVSEDLPVRKYIKNVPCNLFKQTKAASECEPFPTDKVKKTDETNARSCPQCLDEFRNLESYISLKLDGTSITLLYEKGELKVCSRNIVIERNPENTVWEFVINNGIEEKLVERAADRSVAIQGEFVGPKINTNPLRLADYAFYVFDIKDLDTGNYCDLETIQNWCETMELPHVPILDVVYFNDTWTPEMEKLQEYANSVKYDSGITGEGIIIRPTHIHYSPRLGKPLSLKIINQKYKD
jgi:RNA ligase (TIGR02306 family)